MGQSPSTIINTFLNMANSVDHSNTYNSLQEFSRLHGGNLANLNLMKPRGDFMSVIMRNRIGIFPN